ncbi:hypothetical protein [Foetidibacter luteolus]|uniref:hypothetical protein n=1 Tax=Foetidibacter luteolus TaxID=2608880 RepID=UPI00129BE9FD|nr:hypothetical protein [Foetidibacter luteolus]
MKDLHPYQLANAARFTYQLIKNKQTEDKFNKYLVDEKKDWIKKAGEKEATIAIAEAKLFVAGACVQIKSC